jgi:hypothetical protein
MSGKGDFYVDKSKIDGRGCFANRFIKKDEVFTFPVLPVDNFGISPVISQHTFPWFSKENLSCIVIGEVTFANHSSKPNLKILSIDRERMTKTFVALEDIAYKEEVFLRYNDDPSFMRHPESEPEEPVLGKDFLYVVDLDERGLFSAHVEDEAGKIVFSLSNDNEEGTISLVDDGFMRHAKDMRGLTEYLIEHKVIPSDASISVHPIHN